MNTLHSGENGILLSDKAVKMSAAYYNKGLKAAKIDDMTSAIEHLKTSLSINKRNVNARNLLGLCYYVVGQIGDALKQWIISTSFNEKDNLAKGYLESFDHDLGSLERYSEGLRNYNEGLKFLRQFSEDMAAIRLKRAVECIPNFVMAMNLLALLYIKNNDKTRAASLIEKILVIDENNPMAQKYYSEIFQKKVSIPQKTAALAQMSKPAQKKPIQNTNTMGNSPFAAQNRRVFAKPSPISGIIAFIAGLGAMLLFMYILVLPAQLESLTNERDTLLNNISVMRNNHENQINDFEFEIESLTQELLEANLQLLHQQNLITNTQHENMVSNAFTFLERGLYDQAINTLQVVDVNRLSLESREIYFHIYEVARPILEQRYFEQGFAFFNGNNFVDAKAAFESAAAHILETSLFADQIIYHLARIAQHDGDFALARELYERIITDFPNSQHRADSIRRLADIS